MNPIIAAASNALIEAAILQFVEYQKRKAQEADWKPSTQDAYDFLAEINADSPEALKARVAAALGVPWPPPTQ